MRLELFVRCFELKKLCLELFEKLGFLELIFPFKAVIFDLIESIANCGCDQDTLKRVDEWPSVFILSLSRLGFTFTLFLTNETESNLLLFLAILVSF